MTDAMDRWDTDCGVHHGYVFLTGVMFGLLIACVTAVILL